MSIELKLLKAEGDFLRLQSAGRVSRDGLRADQNPITDICGDGVYTRKVLLNFSQSNYLDSTGVEWLLHSHKRFKKEGGLLILHSLTPMMQQILKMMRMETILNVAVDEPAAMKLAQSLMQGTTA